MIVKEKGASRERNFLKEFERTLSREMKLGGDLESRKEFYFQYFVMKVLNVLES